MKILQEKLNVENVKQQINELFNEYAEEEEEGVKMIVDDKLGEYYDEVMKILNLNLKNSLLLKT